MIYDDDNVIKMIEFTPYITSQKKYLLKIDTKCISYNYRHTAINQFRHNTKNQK